MIFINWKFFKIRKRKRKKEDGWRVFILNTQLKIFIWPNFRNRLYQYIVEIEFFLYKRVKRYIYSFQIKKN